MFGIGDAVSAGLQIIDKFIPDPAAKADAIFKLKTLEQQGDLAEMNAYVTLLSGQIETNKIEAASSNIFKSGWRPFIGWVCGAAFAYSYIVLPFMQFFVLIGVEKPPEFPAIDLAGMMPVLLGMLGLGGLRSFEKNNGVD